MYSYRYKYLPHLEGTIAYDQPIIHIQPAISFIIFQTPWLQRPISQKNAAANPTATATTKNDGDGAYSYCYSSTKITGAQTP